MSETQKPKDNQNGKDKSVPPWMRSNRPEGMIDPQAVRAQIKAERVEKLVKGEVEPPNEFASFIVQQLRETIRKGSLLRQQLIYARAEVKKMEQEAIKLEGAADSYASDLEQWDRPLEPASPKTPEEEGAQDETSKTD